MKWMHGALAVMGAVVLAFGQGRGSAGKAGWTLSAGTTGVAGPLREDGVPDYLRVINERESAGVAPENNAFVGWLKIVGTGDGILAAGVRDEVLKMSGAAAGPAGEVHFRTVGQFLKDLKVSGASDEMASEMLAQARRATWSATTMPEMDAYMRDQKDELDALVRVSSRERWWCPMVSVDGRSLLGGQFPSLGTYRSAASALAARAVLRGRRGDFDGFLADALAVKRLGLLVAQGLTALERVVGVSLDAMGSEAIGTVAGAGTLTEAQCRTVRDALAKMPALPSMTESADLVERWYSLDALLQTAAGGMEAVLKGSPSSTRDWDCRHFVTITREDVDWDEVLKSVNHEVDELIAVMKSPTIQELREKSGALDQALQRRYAGLKAPADLSRKAGESAKAYTQRIADAAASALPMTMVKAEELARRGVMFREMVDVLLAAGEEKAATGRWPEPGQLVPGRMKQLPKDLYPIEKPGALRFKVSAGGLRVYSVGQNGKDDGGGLDAARGADDLGVGPME